MGGNFFNKKTDTVRDFHLSQYPFILFELSELTAPELL
jgi:hypothetical protein